MVAARDELIRAEGKQNTLPVLLKVAPDLKEEEKEDIARVIQKPKVFPDELILNILATNSNFFCSAKSTD